MELIKSNRLYYNIGIDVGDNINQVIFNQNDLLPCCNKISYSIPEIDEEYIIKILIGNNILAIDNIILDTIKIKSDDNYKKIFITMNIDYYLSIQIDTKINTIYKNIININGYFINYHIRNENIDINNYKLKFNLLQIIKIINKKIRLNYIILDEESKSLLESKFNNIINKIETLNNQKILEIINTLEQNFFIN